MILKEVQYGLSGAYPELAGRFNQQLADNPIISDQRKSPGISSVR